VTEDVVLHHHERFNGSGYPHGLREHAIPLGARIVSVVESYVAMLQEAPYRTALSPIEALEVLEENWEMRYDPEVVRAFADLVRSEPDPIVEHAVEALLADSVA
jgi:HD-GYP domain-containing protein (c-di-GMP phosphodiesterase class II)